MDWKEIIIEEDNKMAKFKNAKEWGNLVRDKVFNEMIASYKDENDTPDIVSYIFTDEGKNYLVEVLQDVASEMFEELLDLVNRQKRPYPSALKQMADKSKSIASRIDTQLFKGYNDEDGILTEKQIVNPNFFILSIYTRCFNDYGTGKSELNLYGETPEMKRFRKYVVQTPEFQSMLKKHKEDVDEHEKREEAMKHFAPHVCKPLEWYLDKDKSELCYEYIECLHAVGMYRSVGFTVNMFKPLIWRAHFFNYCYKIGGITKELIERYEKDPEAFFYDKDIRKEMGE